MGAEAIGTFALVLSGCGAAALAPTTTATTADGTAVGGGCVGVTLTVTPLVAIPVTDSSVNLAGSKARALFAGCGALWSLWLCTLTPLTGGADRG